MFVCLFFFLNSGNSIIFFHATTIYSVAMFLFHDKQSMKLANRVYQLYQVKYSAVIISI